MPRRDGFTLIELLIVIVILGLLVTFATPYLNKSRDRALVAAMKNDLRTFATQQEIYFARNLIYASNPTTVPDFQPSTGVTLFVTYAQTDGWAATAAHGSISNQCGLFVGNATAADAPPATRAGSAECN
jgi:prepilin-type N-terminal cleavage/methylation domain-containing protein